MTGHEGERRDRELRLWQPGPRNGALRGKGLLVKIPHMIYRKVNAETGVLSSVDRWLTERLGSYHHCRERVVEYPFAYRQLSVEPPATVLVAGGAHSALAYTLASLGYEVHVCDLESYGLRHPNLNVYRGELRKLPFGDGYFDAVVCVSVIEHVGHNDDGRHPEQPAFEEFSRCLTGDGTLILTTPLSETGGLLPNGRVYSLERFRSALPSSLEIDNIETFSREGETWSPSGPDELSPFDGYAISNVLCVTLMNSS